MGNSRLTMRITKGYDVTPRGSHYTSRENSVVSQTSVEQQRVVTKTWNKGSRDFSVTPNTSTFATPTASRRIISNSYSMGAGHSGKMGDDGYMGDLQERLKQAFLEELCRRPNTGLTEVRRDGKDNAAIASVIKKEFERCVDHMGEADFMYH